ncbi:MAG: hypothetical protein HGA86_07050 [Anaerolineaceae bacterium]|nr:hypothetical protein [Anaerolineaceae bacterium]
MLPILEAQTVQYALQALQIRESLNLPEVYRVYDNLAAIARDRGDSEVAARWQAKYEAKTGHAGGFAEGGEGDSGQAGGGGGAVNPSGSAGVLAGTFKKRAYAIV